MAALMAFVFLTGDNARADDPVATSVTYNREIVRVLRRKCFACHGRDGIAMSLATFRDARPWGRAIREELVEQRMPPSVVAPGASVPFRNDLGLTFREMTTLVTWLDGGMPQGNAVDLPIAASLARAGAPDAAADVTLPLPAQAVPALEELVVKEVTIDSGLAEPRVLSSVMLRPGSRRVLRGAIVYAVESATPRGRTPSSGPGQWVGAWSPWQTIVTPPDGYGFQVPAGTRFHVVLYYRGDEASVTDQPSLELRFAPETTRALGQRPVFFAPQPARTRATALAQRTDLVLSEETTIWALQLTTDTQARSLEALAERPDGTIQPLLYIPQLRREWPQALLLKEPMTLPAGSKLRVTIQNATATAVPSSRIIVGVLPH